MDQSAAEDSRRSRPPSEQLVDLHVYIVPEERWLRKRKLARNHVVDYAISAGFIRVLPTARLVDVRREIDRQLGHDVVPKEYVFLRSVGRNFTQVKDFQEMDLKAKSFLPPCASEPEIYLKSGQFADQGWSHGDDSGLDEAYLDARRTHEIIERRIGILSPPPLSSPDTFLPHLDSTRLLLSRPSKGRRSAGHNGAVAGGATTATTTYQWSNGGAAGAGPYQQHRVTTTTTTTTHRSTTTVEETSVRDQVHLLRLPAPPPKEERDPVEREGKPEESERQQEAQQTLDGQSEDRVHEEHTVGEADGPELNDAPPPAASVRRRPSVTSSSPAVTGVDAKDLAPEVDDARAKDHSDGDEEDASAQRDQQREPGEASAAPSPASVRDRRSRSDGAGTVTLTLPSPTSGAPAARTLGSQRRPSLTESRRRSVATVPIAESSRLSVPTFQQQPRKLSFAGGSLGPRRGDEDSGGQRLKARAQSEEALSQHIEGESERRPQRRPSRGDDSRRSSTAVSVDRGEDEQEAEAKPEAGDAEAKAEADAAEGARDERGGGGSSSAEEASSDQEARVDHVQASPSGEQVDRVASEADRRRDEKKQEQEAKVEDGYDGREEAEPEGESRDYFREEGPYRLEVTEEEEPEEGALAQATSVAPVGKASDVAAAPSSQRTWKTTGGGDRTSRRSKYPSSVGQAQLQRRQQKQLSTRAPAATRGGVSVKPVAVGAAKATPQTEMNVPEKVAGGGSRKQPRGKTSGVTVQVAKVRLIPGRPAAEAGTADAEAEVSEIRDYVRRGGERIRDGGGERDASRRTSRKAVNNVDTARTVVESYRKSDAAAAAEAKKPKRERTFDVEVYVTELGETGTQTGGGAEASGKAVKERGSSSKGGGGGSGARRRSRSHKSLSKSDTRGSLLGDKGHVGGDKGADTTDADASSLADSAAIGQDDSPSEGQREAGQQRSGIESDQLDNERHIEVNRHGVDGNISADDEGSGDENRVDRGSTVNEVLHPALDNGVDGDEIKTLVAELQGSVKTPVLVENIQSAEQSETSNDRMHPMTPSDAGVNKHSEESGISGEADENVFAHGEAEKPAITETHGDELNGIEETTDVPDLKQEEHDVSQKIIEAAPSESEELNDHATAPNPDDRHTEQVTEPDNLSKSHDTEQVIENEESNNHSVRTEEDTKASEDVERNDSRKLTNKEKEIDASKRTDDKGTIASNDERALARDENSAKEHKDFAEESGSPLQERAGILEENINEDSNDSKASEKSTSDKAPETAIDDTDKADDQLKNGEGMSPEVDDAIGGRPELDTERNVPGVGTRPGTPATAEEQNDSQSDKTNEERTADGDSGQPDNPEDAEDGENEDRPPQSGDKYDNDKEGSSPVEINDESENAAQDPKEAPNNETDIVDTTSDAGVKESSDVSNQESEASGFPEADQNGPHEDPSVSATLLAENENAKGNELVANEPALESSSRAEGDAEVSEDIAQEATNVEPSTHVENNEQTNDEANGGSESLTNETGLEQNAESDSSEQIQEGRSSTEAKEKDETDENSESGVVELSAGPKDEALEENASADSVSSVREGNDSSKERLFEEGQASNTELIAHETAVSQDVRDEVIGHEPSSNGNKDEGDSTRDSQHNHEETASETSQSAGGTRKASGTLREVDEKEKHGRGSEDPASPDSAEIVDTGEGNEEQILAASEENDDAEGQGDTHLEEENVDDEAGGSDRDKQSEPNGEVEGTVVPEQEQSVSEADAKMPDENSEHVQERISDNVEENIQQETATECALAKDSIEQADRSEISSEQDEVTKPADVGEDTERTNDSDVSAGQGEPENAPETDGGTRANNELQMNVDEDSAKPSDTKGLAEEAETEMLAATTDRASPTTDVDTSRTEDDSAFADGTCTSTPSPATSRAELTSPKDLLREGENLDEGILADEPPATRDSQKDQDEDGEGAVDATSSSSGRGSRGTVTEVPLPVTHKPQIRGQQQPRASRNAEAAKAPKIRAPKGVSVLPSRFKPPMRRTNGKEHPAIAGTGGVRRVQSDGEHIDQTAVGASRTALTTPEQRLDNAGRLLGRHSRSVNMEEQGLLEIARLQKRLDALREERLACEAKREDLLRRAKFLQGKATSTRDQARDMWRRRYAEEKKITPKLEEESARWRLELERLHRELLARVEGELRLTGYPRFEQPSNKLSYKIMIAKVLQEIEDLKRRLEYTRISLGAEVRLRTHAEREVKNLREDLLKKKIQVTLTKKETQSVMAPFLRDSFYFVGPI